jgi:hypothetical protein
MRMSWKFWENSKGKSLASFSRLMEWPTSAYDSVKFLFGMYVQETPPFADWCDGRETLLPELEDLARHNVKGQQLWLWFDLYRRRRGQIEANMLRDAFCSLFDSAADRSKGIGAQIRWLLDFQDRAIAEAGAAPADKKDSVDAAFGVEVPLEYYVAMYQLLAFPDSPYKAGCGPQPPQSQESALCIRLLTGKRNAYECFVPMIDAIKSFEASEIPSWEWLKTPGAHERHLQRRYKNPLFPSDRRTVSTVEVYAARVNDAEALEAARKTVVEIMRAFDDNDWLYAFNEVRERIDATRQQLRRAGGDIATIDNLLKQYRKLVIDTWRARFQEDAQGLEGLEHAERIFAEKERSILGTSFGSQLTNPANPIPASEVIPALLCEDPDTVALYVQVLAGPERIEALKWAAEIVSAADKEGIDIMTIKEQLYALGFPRPQSDGQP